MTFREYLVGTGAILLSLVGLAFIGWGLLDRRPYLDLDFAFVALGCAIVAVAAIVMLVGT